MNGANHKNADAFIQAGVIEWFDGHNINVQYNINQLNTN